MRKKKYFHSIILLSIFSMLFSSCKSTIIENEIETNNSIDFKPTSTYEKLVSENDNNNQEDNKDAKTVVENDQLMTSEEEIKPSDDNESIGTSEKEVKLSDSDKTVIESEISTLSTSNDTSASTKEPHMTASDNTDETAATNKILYNYIKTKIDINYDYDFIYTFFDSSTDERKKIQTKDKAVFIETLKAINILNIEENVRVSTGYKNWIEINKGNDLLMRISGADEVIILTDSTQTIITCDTDTFNALKSAICDNS